MAASKKKPPVARFEDAPTLSGKDFLAFERHKWSDPEANAERLLLKRKLAAIGAPIHSVLAAHGADLTLRTSIHNPFKFNGNRVDSLWLYFAPSDAAKKPLRDLLGVEFESDTDASYVHANLVFEIDFHGVNMGLRVHERAWWDVANAKRRCGERAGAEEFARRLNEVRGGYALRLHDWKQEYRCGALKWDDLLGYFRYCEPGQHRMLVWKSLKKDDPRLFEPGFVATVADEFASFLPVYDWLLWSPQNNHLLGSR
jgi:hypothetical protein